MPTTEQDTGAVTGPERRLLEIIYKAFAAVGGWPFFSYVSGELWREQIEARDIYLQLSERRLVDPVIARTHEFQLHDDTTVGVSLLGLTYIQDAAEDLSRFITTVRHVADWASRFRPTSPNAVERLTVSSGEIAPHLGLDAADPSITRLGVLLTQEGWPLQRSFQGPGDNGWSLDVNIEQARRYVNVYSVPEFLDLRDPSRRPPSHPTSASVQTAPTQHQPTTANNKVMIVHGRDLQARDALFNLLRALKLDPIEWNEAVTASGSATPYTGDAVNAAFQMAHAAVILCTPDEAVALRADLRNPDKPEEAVAEWQPRPNVYFEGGIAFTSHPDRTVVVVHGRVRVASDLLGRNVVDTSNKNWRYTLAQRLTNAGCTVSQSGEDWLNIPFPTALMTPPSLADLGLSGLPRTGFETPQAIESREAHRRRTGGITERGTFS